MFRKCNILELTIWHDYTKRLKSLRNVGKGVIVMNTQTTIPTAIWDARKFKWKLYLQGKFESLNGCPNWLYEVIRQLKSSGQVQDGIINVVISDKYQYAIQFKGDNIQIFSKKK